MYSGSVCSVCRIGAVCTMYKVSPVSTVCTVDCVIVVQAFILQKH